MIMNQGIRHWMNLILESYSSIIEEWITIKIFGVDAHVGWTHDKNTKNLKSHSLPLVRGVDVLQDPHMMPDDHELNNKFVGRSHDQILTVAAQWLNEEGDETEAGEDMPIIRLISVRESTLAEQERYMKRNSNLTEMEQRILDTDPDNPPITDFSHFTTADTYWRKKLAPWIHKQQRAVTKETHNPSRTD